MRLPSILLLALVPLVLANPAITKRSADQVYNDITGIDTAVRKLTTAINAYNGGITQSTTVFDAPIAVHAINRQGFSDATASSSFTSAESKRIVDQ